MVKHESLVSRYSWLIGAYQKEPELFVRLAKNDTKFKDMGSSLTDAMFKLGRGCFTLLEEHKDDRADDDKSFDLNGVYRLISDAVVKVPTFAINNLWHFNWQGQLFRLHEAPSIVGYLGVDFMAGDWTVPVKSLAASAVYDGNGIDPVTVTSMPAIPESVLFFAPLMWMLREANITNDF